MARRWFEIELLTTVKWTVVPALETIEIVTLTNPDGTTQVDTYRDMVIFHEDGWSLKKIRKITFYAYRGHNRGWI
jgi:hypothetical protein